MHLLVLLLSTCAAVISAHPAQFPKFGTFEHPIFKPLKLAAHRTHVKLTSEGAACVPDKWSSAGKGMCLNTDDLDAKCSDREISTSKDCAAFDGNWCCYTPQNKQSIAKKESIAPATIMKTAQAAPQEIKAVQPVEVKKEEKKDVKAEAAGIKVHVFEPSVNPHPALTRQRLQKLHTQAQTLINHRRFPIHSIRP